MQDQRQREALWVFRERVYHAFDRRRDALFDLLDALLVAGLVPAFVHLSLAGLFRRGWGSAYAALAHGAVDAPALREIVAAAPLEAGTSVYALDTSVWARCDAERSPQREYYHHPSRQSAGQPIVAGWSYSWLAQLSFRHDSWTAPLEVRRVPPSDDVHVVAAAQIRELLGRQPADGPVPLCVFDAGYDLGTLAGELGDVDEQRVAVLVRLRSDRCFYAEPTSQPKIGRLRRHGPQFACADARTWWAPTTEHTEEHAQYGQVRVRAWAGIYAKIQHRPTLGHRRPIWPILHGTLVLVEVQRLPRQARIPNACGCGGAARLSPIWSPIWPWSGAPTSAAVTWSTPSASANRF